MADLNKIIENLSSLTVVEAAELSKQLEEKWGVKAAAAVAAAPAAEAAPTKASGSAASVHWIALPATARCLSFKLC